MIGVRVITNRVPWIFELCSVGCCLRPHGLRYRHDPGSTVLRTRIGHLLRLFGAWFQENRLFRDPGVWTINCRSGNRIFVIYSNTISGWPAMQVSVLLIYALHLGGFLLMRSRSSSFQKELKAELQVGSPFEGVASRGLSQFSDAKKQALDVVATASARAGIPFTVVRPTAYFSDLTNREFESVATNNRCTLIGDGLHHCAYASFRLMHFAFSRC